MESNSIFDLTRTDISDQFTTYIRDVLNEEVDTLINDRKTRLIVDMDQVSQLRKMLQDLILFRTTESIAIGTESLTRVIRDKTKNSELGLEQEPGTNFYLGFSGFLGTNMVTPRGLATKHQFQLVRVCGIVTKVSEVCVRLEKSVHYCPATSKGHVQQQPDPYKIKTNQGQKALVLPTTDLEKNPLICEQGLCSYSNFQTITIQELAEDCPSGSIARSAYTVCFDDLAGVLKPGDKVFMTGLYKAYNKGGLGAVKYNTTLIATNFEQLNYNTSLGVTYTAEDIGYIKEEAEDADLMANLANSVCPYIEGKQMIKKALLLLLMGGTEINMSNGSRLRGDVNILLCGDPGCGKSQLLRATMNLAPNCINTTGKGSSGVGLTAAVVRDEHQNNTIQAGAMVLADRGVLCIDEFDKMEEFDRVAIHEGMEQQTVTINKAGLHLVMNTRCSVLAASNPINSSYNFKVPIRKNLAIPDSLISRFDLVFIVIDEHDVAKDEIIAKRILENHANNVGEPKSELCSNLFDLKKRQVVDFKENNRSSDIYKIKDNSKVQSVEFLKKQIDQAKRIKPQMSEDVIEQISGTQCQLRQNQFRNTRETLPVTTRIVETLIRLSNAHAKARLSKQVTVQDVEAAAELVDYSINVTGITEAQTNINGSSNQNSSNPTEMNNDQRVRQIADQINNLQKKKSVVYQMSKLSFANKFQSEVVENKNKKTSKKVEPANDINENETNDQNVQFETIKREVMNVLFTIAEELGGDISIEEVVSQVNAKNIEILRNFIDYQDQKVQLDELVNENKIFVDENQIISVFN